MCLSRLYLTSTLILFSKQIQSDTLQTTFKMPHAHPKDEMTDPITVLEVRDIAKKRLDPEAWDYYITGADGELSVRRNESIFKK